jgi:AcrR family transcriptional regulator
MAMQMKRQMKRQMKPQMKPQMNSEPFDGAPLGRGAGRPREARVDEAIADAVAELLAEVGYDSLTIEGVAARAGVAKTTVYRRWSSKTQLVGDALEVRARGRVRAPDTGSLAGDLLAHVQAVSDALAAPIGRAIMGLVSGARRNPELSEALHEGFIAARRGEVAELLARAESRGELRSDLDHGVVIDLIISPLWYRALVWCESPGTDRLQALVDILLPGLTAEGR